ncbi:MAG: cupin domain-containing protein [Planctomycetia bacterium]|nr:cupin domain-containing protein [Planctomycetia bacterium]
MAEIKPFKGYQGTPRTTKPEKPVQPNVVGVKDGCPVKYPGCEGIGVRVVHPSNPRAPAQNFGQTVFFVPPHVVLKPGCHENEECYYILRGRGLMTLAGKPVPVEAGMFIHLPPWCEHGIENTSNESLEVLITTSPPIP